ncbi:hypothetical protein KUV51_00680 [Tateyamaria omphalii]|uniref:hypothetical protein n=1 Tax=Tateyamaria omphalii TaxID=299262 RepID=UPI001C992BB6|nr:hypothetical protein [Tateyamaria omphalii]MBY5931495.1 hypothetical protein [Tateyamaria omphalii]
MEAAGWTDNHQRRLQDYCDLFEVPVEFTVEYPFVCLQVLVAMFLVPNHDQESERDAAGMELRQIMAEAFGLTRQSAMSGVLPHQRFYQRVNMILINMRVLPQWWDLLRASPEELVKLHKSLRLSLYVLSRLGASGAAAAPAAVGISSAVSAREAFGNAEGRLRDRAIASARAAGSTAVDNVTGRSGPLSKLGRGGLVGGALIVTGMALYDHGQRRLEMVEDLLEIAYREGRATEEQYMSMFEDLDPDQVNLERYWE